jgi:hypothetical protein
MDRTHRRQADRPVQLNLFAKVRPRPANDSDPFASTPGPTRGVFNGVLDNRGKQKAKVVSLGLTLRDAVLRSGPAEAYAE